MTKAPKRTYWKGHRRFLGPMLIPGPDRGERITKYRLDALPPERRAQWIKAELDHLGLQGIGVLQERLNAYEERIRQIEEQQRRPPRRRASVGGIDMPEAAG